MERAGLIALISLASAAVRAEDGGAVDLAELASRAKPAVVHLSILDLAGKPAGNGTGFFVTTDGVIATNHHVVQPAHAMRATLASGETLEVQGVLAKDETRDIALLKVAGGPYPTLPFARRELAAEGTPVVVLGSPLGLSWTLSEGIVAAHRDQVPGELVGGAVRQGPLIQITAPISPGSSGSPVMNRSGEVVGMAVLASVRAAQNVNFAVPVAAVIDALARVAPGAAPDPIDRVHWGNAVASALVFAALGGALYWTRRGRKRGRRP